MPDGRLDLCKQALGLEHTRELLPAAAAHPWLQHVLLGTNGLGDAGAHALSAWLGSAALPPNLATLYLGCNRIGPSGLAALASAVEETPTLCALWLKRNPLTASSAPRLCALLTRSQLQVLDLT